MGELGDSSDGFMGTIKVFITWMAKALMPQHSASPILNGKDRNFQEGNVDRIVAVVDFVAVIVVDSVDVSGAVFETPVLK